MNNALVILNNLNNKDGLDIYVKWITRGGRHIPILGKSESRFTPAQTKAWKAGAPERKEAGIEKRKATIAAKGGAALPTADEKLSPTDRAWKDAESKFEKSDKAYDAAIKAGGSRDKARNEREAALKEVRDKREAAGRDRFTGEVRKEPPPMPEKKPTERVVTERRTREPSRGAEQAGTENAEIGSESLNRYYGTGYDKWRNGLTNNEREGIEAYTGMEYQEYNYALRHKQSQIKTTEGLPDMMRGMDKARAPKDMVVYRGIDDKRFHADPAKMVGSTISDKGFSSSSLSKKVADGYLDSDIVTYPVLTRIKVPKGAKAAEISFAGMPKGRMARLSKEASEVVMNRNSTYKVTGVKKVGKKVLVDMELQL